MTTETLTLPPRRNWHFARWFIVFLVAILGWSGWRAYTFRAALKQAVALRWAVMYTDPAKEIAKNWKNAFAKKTWLDGVTLVFIKTGEEFEKHSDIVQRLNPRGLHIWATPNLRDLSALKGITRLGVLAILGGTNLTNVDALKNLSALKWVYLDGCTGLTNVDALHVAARRGDVVPETRNHHTPRRPHRRCPHRRP